MYAYPTEYTGQEYAVILVEESPTGKTGGKVGGVRLPEAIVHPIVLRLVRGGSARDGSTPPREVSPHIRTVAEKKGSTKHRWWEARKGKCGGRLETTPKEVHKNSSLGAPCRISKAFRNAVTDGAVGWGFKSLAVSEQ